MAVRSLTIEMHPMEASGANRRTQRARGAKGANSGCSGGCTFWTSNYALRARAHSRFCNRLRVQNARNSDCLISLSPRTEPQKTVGV